MLSTHKIQKENLRSCHTFVSVTFFSTVLSVSRPVSIASVVARVADLRRCDQHERLPNTVFITANFSVSMSLDDRVMASKY